MAILESQLETWSHQGSVTQSSSTYNTIKTVLVAVDTPYAAKNFSVFLQGSYGNDTNIFAESDVDIVIKLDDCFQSDLSALSPDDQNAYKGTFPDATYTYNDFKRDVLRVLKDKYGRNVLAGNKAIAIAANGSRRKADVIAAIQYRRYYRFKSIDDQLYYEGICFYTSEGISIANYPKQHSANLTTKHQGTKRWFKPMVRILKNMRSKLVDEGIIKGGTAPSYYLEGLLYNVPNHLFTTSFQDCFVNAINWIQTEADKTNLVCANEQYYLLRDNSHTSWSNANCDIFLNAVISLWNE